MRDFQTKLEGQGAGKVKEFPDVSCLSEMFRYDLIGLEIGPLGRLCGRQHGLR